MFKRFPSAIIYSTLLQRLKTPKLENHTSHFHCRIPPSNPAIQFILEETEGDLRTSPEPIQQPSYGNEEISRSRQSDYGVEISHPWSEWSDLMEKLLKNGYFAGAGNPFLRNDELGIKNSNLIRTACLNFARDQFDLLRYLSRKDIEVIAQAGCPSVDRKVVNSGKRLRFHLGIDEVNVCSSCALRGNCERAYVKAREDEGGRTVDVMRFLLTYGLDPIYGSVENKPCLNRTLKESVRKLLKEVVQFSTEEGGYETQNTNIGRSYKQEILEYHRNGRINVSMKQGDWLCAKCNFLNFARNIKCLCCNGLSQERLHNLRGKQDNLPLKKGDWICDKCNFLNFAKNTRCLQCKENPPKRRLHPGEWECESCNYINFKRNMVCLKCDHQRPRASNSPCSSSLPATSNTSNHLSWRPNSGTDSQFRDGFYKTTFIKSDSDASVSWNQEMEYVDVPILGGKSDLSRIEQKQAKWKREVVEKNTTTTASKAK